MLFFAAAVARFGWFMAHYPEKAIRIFTFGTEPACGKRFGLTWSRVVGWIFTVGGCIGTVLYLILIPVDFFH